MLSLVPFLLLVRTSPPGTQHRHPTSHSDTIHQVKQHAPILPFKLDPRVVGTWWPAIDSLKVSSPGHPEMAGQLAKAMDMIEDKLAYINLTFKSDGTYSAVDPDNKATHGSYRVTGNSIWMSNEFDMPNSKIVVSQDGSALDLRMSTEGIAITFTMIKM